MWLHLCRPLNYVAPTIEGVEAYFKALLDRQMLATWAIFSSIFTSEEVLQIVPVNSNFRAQSTGFSFQTQRQ